jgi:hypothetical protein
VEVEEDYEDDVTADQQPSTVVSSSMTAMAAVSRSVVGAAVDAALQANALRK